MASMKTTPSFAPGRAQWGITFLLSVFVALGTLYALLTPLFEISDELWHYPMVKTIADGNGLPVQDPRNPGPWRQEGSQPPLYYALMAAATFWIDTRDMEQVRWLNPHVDNGIITQDRNNNILIHTYRETEWPWRGTVLAVRLIRLLSVLLGALTVYFTYRLALEVWPGQTGWALLAAGLTAFVPMFIFISASVNNDNLAITLASAALWLMARWLRRSETPGELPSLKQAAVMGLLLGGAALSKVSALGLWPLAAAALIYAHLRPAPLLSFSPARFKALFVPLAIIFTVAFLASFWWFLRNYQLYGDWLGWNAFLATVGSRPHPASLEQLWGERVGFIQAYWGLFGGVSVAMPEWVYTDLNLFVMVSGVGLVLAGGRFLILDLRFLIEKRRLALPPAQVALWLMVLAWVVVIFIGLARWTSLTWASQGRLIFPAIAAISVLLAAGIKAFYDLWAWVGRLRSSRTAQLPGAAQPPLLILAAFFLLALFVPFTIIAPHYAPPPALTPAQLAALPQRVAADFGELRLLGYALETTALQPGEAVRLTLYWQSQIPMDRNWSIFVHLVDDAGVIAAQRDRYPGNGALATTLLQPGQTWADTYVIPVSPLAYAPTALRVVVGVFDLRDGTRLRLRAGGEAVTLAEQVQLARADEQVPNQMQQNFGQQVELAGYAYSQRVVQPGETVMVTLYWRALQPLTVNYSAFAHVRGLGETLWAGRDQWPQNGAAPTSTWVVGQIVTDTYALTLLPATPPGQYPIEVGLYDPALQRLRLLTPEGLPSDLDYLDLSPLRVEP